MIRSSMSKNLIDAIYSRRSIRKYTTEPVNDKYIETLLKVAMAAPSASNKKPWHFIVISFRETLNRLAEALRYGKMLFEASLCISVCGDMSASENYWVQDCSAATENILLAATALGLGAVWLGVHPREGRSSEVCEILDIPEGYAPLNLIAIGHPAEEKEPRTQYEAERVHKETW